MSDHDRRVHVATSEQLREARAEIRAGRREPVAES
jgi:hypothetical protein